MTLCQVQALLQLQRPKEAEGELLALASTDSAPTQLVMDAAAAMMEAPGFGGSLLSALAMLLKRPAESAASPVQILELILGRVDGQVFSDLCRDHSHGVGAFWIVVADYISKSQTCTVLAMPSNSTWQRKDCTEQALCIQVQQSKLSLWENGR